MEEPVMMMTGAVWSVTVTVLFWMVEGFPAASTLLYWMVYVPTTAVLTDPDDWKDPVAP